MHLTQLTRGSTAWGVALFILVWLGLIGSGVSVAQSSALTVFLILQTIPGLVVWKYIRREKVGFIELLGMGLVIGPIICTFSGLLSQKFGLNNWGWLIPVAVASTYFFARRRSVFTATPIPTLSETWSFASALVIGALTLIPNVRNYPLGFTQIASKFHPDMYFFETLSTSLAKYGTSNSLFSPDASIHYHWLVYAWAGQLSLTAQASSFVALTRVLPMIAILSASLVAIAWVRTLTKVSWAPLLAVVLLILGGYVGATYGVIFNFDSPSQATTAGWMLAMSFALTLLLTPHTMRRSAFIASAFVVALIAAGLITGKVSSGVIAFAGVSFVVLAGIIKRTWWHKRALGVLILSLIASSISYLIIVAGSADPGELKFGGIWDRASSVQGVNPLPGTAGVILGTLILVIAIVIRWCGMLWFLRTPFNRMNPSVILATGCAIAGVGAVLLLASGLNETWFALAASVPITVVSAAGVAEAVAALKLESSQLLKIITFSVLSSVFITLVVSFCWLSGASGGNSWVGTFRWLGPIAAITLIVLLSAVIVRFVGLTGFFGFAWFACSLLVALLVAAQGRFLGLGQGEAGVLPSLSTQLFRTDKPAYLFYDSHDVSQWGQLEQSAINWLDAHANKGDLIATNLLWSSFVPAVTKMQTYVSGMRYLTLYGTPEMQQTFQTREIESWFFVNKLETGSISQLCNAGVKWAWIDPMRSQRSTWEPYATSVFSNESVNVLRMNCSPLQG